MIPSLFDLVRVVDFTNWVTLAVIGIAAIVLGSVYERRAKKPADPA